jgi:hypothetical protein
MFSAEVNAIMKRLELMFGEMPHPSDDGDMRRFAAPKTVSWLLLTIVGLAAAANAQSETAWWPQLDTFIGLRDNVQLEFLGSGTINTDSRNQQMVLGPSIDFTLAPFLISRVKTLNKSRNNYLELRLGYRYVATLGNRSSHTHRGLIEATPRLPLPAQLVLADRNQLVLVGGQAQVSWLYRNRLTLARSFETHALIFTPYIQGQVVYNSGPGEWSRYNCDVGSVFKLSEHVELEPYFRHAANIDGSGHPLNGMGFKVELFFRNRSDQ